MLIAPKPTLNLLSGWQYLLDPQYRQDTKDEWQTQPVWIVAAQITAGICSIIFPLIVVFMLAWVFVSRQF